MCEPSPIPTRLFERSFPLITGDSRMVQMFHRIQFFMGDCTSYFDSDTDAIVILQDLAFRAIGDPFLRDEMFCLVVKQLIGCPDQ